MILLGSLASAVALAVSAVLLAGAGKRALSLLGLAFANPLESLLFSISLGIIALELAVTAGELVPNVRYGVIGAATIVALSGLTSVAQIVGNLRELGIKLLALPKLERLLASALLAVLALEGLAALAPLTGSDALHYHFPSQLFFLRQGFQPNWSLLHGFFAGLGHQLILTGLAFGSDKLASGWLCLGGLAATLATVRLAGQFVGGPWPFVTALVFALTPVAFWQITAAGAPDVWMCALLPLAVLAILLAARAPDICHSVLAGILAGALAGAKYTGILMAGTLLIAFAIELRALRKCLVFVGSALAVGVWPYLRNWIWTGDPVFPFWFVRHFGFVGNPDALRSLLKDTGASNPHPFLRVIRFPIFAVTDYGYATWQFLGPLILALGPIALLSFRKTSLWRVVLIVWLIVSLGVGKTSGIPRFLLPVLPLALAASIGGAVLATQHHFRLLRAVTVLSLAGFCLAGFAALCAYASPAWSVVLGRTSPQAYLSGHAPDYERSLFVNARLSQLRAGDDAGRALIFYRHVYYVRVPFLDGDSEDSWEMYPAALQTRQSWLDLFAREHIRWVVKAPAYPEEFAKPLTRLQNDGVLRLCASGAVENIQGFRMSGQLASEPIAILCVQP